MFNREMIVEMLASNDFVAFTFTKVSGDVTTRVGTIRKRPEDAAPKGVMQGRSEKDEKNFRYYECGRIDKYNPDAPGNWSSFAIERLSKMEPIGQPENWTGE